MISDVKKFLVPVDTSEQANQAFLRAVDLAKKTGASIDVVYVVDEDLLTEGNQHSVNNDVLISAQKRLLNAYERQAESLAFGRMQTIARIGDPKRQIIYMLREDPEYGLVVMGATGKNAVERIFVGSVSQYVVRNAQVPVLLIR